MKEPIASNRNPLLVNPPAHLTIDIFKAADEPSLFEDYLRTKYEVFILEKGTRSLPHDPLRACALPDAFDYAATIITARLALDGVVGALRITEISAADEFPHRDLFAHHLNAAAIRRLKAFKISALGVEKSFRGGQFWDEATNQLSSVGAALLNAAKVTIQKLGGGIVFLSTDAKGALSFFQRQGFLVIDKPQKVGRMQIVNMGLLIQDAASLKTEGHGKEGEHQIGTTTPNLRQLLAQDYLEQRQRKINKRLLAKKTAKAS